MVVSFTHHQITWEKLPADYPLPDDPVDNINQPALAAALNDSLATAGKLSDTTLTPTNYGICATLNGKIVVKAPDWAFVPDIRVPRSQVQRSYTPQLEGEIPAIVMEFLSDTEGGEYSTKPTYPPGKWFFYEQILQVPYYTIFEPEEGTLEVYRWDNGRYQLQSADENGRYSIASMNLSLGVWEGCRGERVGYWLRWWDESGKLLRWASELAQEERQRADTAQQQAQAERQRAQEERQRADTAQQQAQAERQRAEQLAARLREAGIDLDA